MSDQVEPAGDVQPAAQPNVIWLIDRSRIVDGRGFCQRARLLNYHVGPNGYGIQLKATKLPLMTGIAGHAGIAPILEWCRDNDDLIVQGLSVPSKEDETYLPVPAQVVRDAVKAAQEQYSAVIATRGFFNLEGTPDALEVVTEQNYLIEGLIWSWCLEVLPEVLRRGKIIEVEREGVLIFDCTCGLGEGILEMADHVARGCQGKGLQNRPDFIVETRHTFELEYHEFKTTGSDSVTFRDKWEVMIQMFATTLDVERRLGKHVQTVYVHGLIKGKREGEYNPDTGNRDGIIRQQSPFCYGFRNPGAPPMEPEQWAFSYKYWSEEEQRTKQLPRAYKKAPVWELPDWMVPEGMSRGEFWVTSMPSETRRKQLALVGPLSRQSLMVDHFLIEAGGEENRWQTILWELYDCAVALLQLKGYDVGQVDEATWWREVWADPTFQAAIDARVPRSYECRRYGSRNKCVNETLCFYHEGWADPLGSGLYISRRPHHQPELDQAIERGLLPPGEGAADEGETEVAW